MQEINEDEKQDKMNEDNQNTDVISNLYGEEEDEDDLLKSDSESNTSFKSFRQMEAKDLLYDLTKKNNDKNENNDNNDNNDKNDKIEHKNSDENNTKNDDNILRKSSVNLVDSLELERRIREERRRRNTGPPRRASKPKDISKDKDREFEEEEDEDEDEEEEEDEKSEEITDSDDEDNESESINPYQKYANSRITQSPSLPLLNKRDVLYDKKSKEYYIFMGCINENSRHIYINHNVLKRKRKDEIFNVIEQKYIGKNFINGSIYSELFDSINQPDFLVSLEKQEKEKETPNEILIIPENRRNEFSVFKKIKIHYLNYLNTKFTFTVLININIKLKDFVNMLTKMYHFPNQKSLNKSNITLFIKGEQYTGKCLNYSNEALFVPSLFDYDKDYVFILEYQNFDIINLDLGSKNAKYNFQGEKVPHIVFSSYNNFCLESILVSNKLSYLECDIYVFKDELCLNVERNIGKYNFRKAKDILSSIDWKDKCKFLTTIKSIKSSTYRNNDDVISFSITSNLILRHNKTYVFLINTPKININVFNSGCGDQGLFIISSDDKAILNGFVCKKLSDFCLNFN